MLEQLPKWLESRPLTPEDSPNDLGNKENKELQACTPRLCDPRNSLPEFQRPSGLMYATDFVLAPVPANRNRGRDFALSLLPG
jgi:hypothetical protein